MSGMWIVIEGGDGSGKTTLAKNLYNRVREIEEKVLMTREPGSPHSRITDTIRKLLKCDMGEQPVALAELFLFMADRAHHYETVIKPKLKDGWIIIQDRGFMSTVAYQGYGRGIDVDIIRGMNEMILHLRKPDTVILVDTPLDIAMTRIGKRQDDIETFNVRSFQEKVLRGFSDHMTRSDVRMLIIDGTKSPEAMCHDAMLALTKVAY